MNRAYQKLSKFWKSRGEEIILRSCFSFILSSIVMLVINFNDTVPVTNTEIVDESEQVVFLCNSEEVELNPINNENFVRLNHFGTFIDENCYKKDSYNMTKSVMPIEIASIKNCTYSKSNTYTKMFLNYFIIRNNGTFGMSFKFAEKITEILKNSVYAQTFKFKSLFQNPFVWVRTRAPGV